MVYVRNNVFHGGQWMLGNGGAFGEDTVGLISGLFAS